MRTQTVDCVLVGRSRAFVTLFVKSIDIAELPLAEAETAGPTLNRCTSGQGNICRMDHKICLGLKRGQNCIASCQLGSSDRPSLLAKYCRTLNEARKSTMSPLSSQSCSCCPTASHTKKRRTLSFPVYGTSDHKSGTH